MVTTSQQNSTLYAEVSDVEEYAKEHGKQFWLILSESEKKDFVERASNKIHVFHNQGHLWRHSELVFACILQAVHFGKFAGSADIGEHAHNSGGFSDGVTTAGGGKETFDAYALALVKGVMTGAGLIPGDRWGRG